MKHNFLHQPQQADFIHCIGIGGIGVSAIAKLLAEKGKHISGTDVSESETIKRMRSLGIPIIVGKHHPKNIPIKTQVIVYSPAIDEKNPERMAAAKKNIPCISYPEMIGHLMKDMVGIAIAGTHGKTTTTAIIGHILVSARLDPTVIVGSYAKNLGDSNERLGKGNMLVVEADEYRGSFLNYKPTVAVITTIDADHLDYYRDLNHILQTFTDFILRMQPDGVCILNADDPTTTDMLASLGDRQIITYGIHRGDVRATDINYATNGTSFVVRDHAGFTRIESPLFGEHNVRNMLAAYACARYLGIDTAVISKCIKAFSGTWRRMDILETIHGITIIDDYAHHPTEIRALMNGLKQKYPGKRIIIIFQPHQDDRFTKLFNDFPVAFAGATMVFLTEIFDVAGRQGKRDSSQRLVPCLEKIGIPVFFGNTFEELRARILREAKKSDVLVFVGAGDITKLRAQVVMSLKSKK